MKTPLLYIFILFSFNLFGLRAQTVDSTNIPLVIINTQDSIIAASKVNGTIKIIDNGPGKMNHPGDAPVYSSNIGVKYHGSFSLYFPQKSYAFETRDALNNSVNVSLLGLPAENDWILLQHYNDKSFVRNTLTFRLFQEMGHYASRAKYCEMYVNNHYMGVYTLIENIKRDKNRVNIAKMTATSNVGDSLTGGYIFKVDNIGADDITWNSSHAPTGYSVGSVQFIYSYPKSEDITTQQKNYLKNYVDTFENAIFGNGYTDPRYGYNKYLDVQSFVDYFITGEFTRNIDAYKKSAFFFKDNISNGGLIHAGPVWDFDWAYKNFSECFENTLDGSGWAYKIYDCSPWPVPPAWTMRLVSDTVFANKCHDRYFQLRKTILSIPQINFYIDSIANLLDGPQKRHYALWNTLGKRPGVEILGTPEIDSFPKTYQGEVAKLKKWISQRLDFLDANMIGKATVITPKKLIHYWHFNSTASAVHLGPIPADYSTLGNGSLIYKPIPGGGPGTAQAYIDNINPGDTINQRPGFAGCCGATNYAVRTRNPSDNMQFLWYIPTKKYQNIVIKYETQSSSTASGPHRQVFSYSVDSGLHFITAGLPAAYDSAGLLWGKVVLDLSSLPAVNNNDKFVFKMTFTAPNTGTSGNNRFDNITVEGDTMLAPVITSTALTGGIINLPYSYTIKSTGDPAPTFSVSGNPTWLTLHDNVLSGTPTLVDTIDPITITATNPVGSNQQVFTLIIDDVTPVAPAITSVAPTAGILATLFTYKIATTGIPKPAISVSGKPAWLTLTDTVLSGTPPSGGIFGPITITAINIAGNAQQSFSITVPSVPLITSAAITVGIAHSLYMYTISATGTPAPGFSISGNPSWLTLSGNILSGTPPTVGTFGPITITVVNTKGSNQQTFNIIVSSAPAITSTVVTLGTVGSVYIYNITATGTPAPVISVAGYPTWLTMSGSKISGTPASSGLIGPITVTATNSVSVVHQIFFIKVANPSVNTSASKLIHYWHFNNTLPADGSGGISFGTHPIVADYSTLKNAALVYQPLQGVVKDTGSIDNLQGDTINQRSGFGGCCGTLNNAVRTRNPSDSMRFLWYLPTSNYKNIVIKYETQSSSTKSGQREQIFSYSLDSASTFINSAFPVISNFADTVWQKVTLDLRSVTSVNNNGKFVLRINFSAPNTGNKGNNRFDNITVEGDPISGTGITEIAGADYILYPIPAYDHINLITPFEGDITISIYNSTGGLISVYNLHGKESMINTSHLSPGFYFMKISEKKGEMSKTLKFIKE
jgi:formylmethanofuran dehydrogenase subunit D